jgi:prepilin-type N-terminal cleavage/methylation domain-containing protein
VNHKWEGETPPIFFLIFMRAKGHNSLVSKKQSTGIRFIRNRGFSLIELLVIVSILGIMIGVAIPQWNRAASIRAMEKRNANLRTLNITADRMSINEDGQWVAGADDNGNGIIEDNEQNWVPLWPVAFVNPPMSTDAEKAARAEQVAEFFFDQSYLPQHLRDSLDLEGIGYHPSGFFVPLAMP